MYPLDGGNWGSRTAFEPAYRKGDHWIHAPHPLLLSLLHLSPQQHAAIKIPPLLLPSPQLFLSFSPLHFHVQLWRARLMRYPRSFLDRSVHPFDPKRTFDSFLQIGGQGPFELILVPVRAFAPHCRRKSPSDHPSSP